MPQDNRRTLNPDDFMRQMQAQPTQSLDPDMFMRAQQQPPQEGAYERFKRNIGLGFEALGQKVSDVVAAGGEIAGGIATGDFRPLGETLEKTGRAVGGLLMGGNPSFAAPAQANREAMARVQAERDARRQASGDIYFRGSAIENARLEAEAAKDPSLFGRITRAAPQILPYALAGVASGGSIPAMAATGAVMELNEPENIPSWWFRLVNGARRPGPRSKCLRDSAIRDTRA